MQASVAWKKTFSHKELLKLYYETIESNASTGIDKITPQSFKEHLAENVKIICRKANNSTYTFTRYKQILISKGKNKCPREINVPTIRDKLTLAAINTILQSVYGNDCITKSPQVIIDEINLAKRKHDAYVKIDIKSFYSSIEHEQLIKTLKKKVRKSQLLRLIKGAIETESIPLQTDTRGGAKIRTKGLPEGLSISNALANVFLSSLDKKYKCLEDISYWRYVDDILILTNEKNAPIIREQIKNDLKTLGLRVNINKCSIGQIQEGFEYLGYKINDERTSVRESNILRIERSIEELFSSIKDGNLKLSEWKINLRITGSIMNGHRYGWLFFFNRIDDYNLLFHLDKVVNKLATRYQVKDELSLKRFVKAYHEIKKAIHTTKYVPNFDKWTLEEKEAVLSSIYKQDLSTMSPFEKERLFERLISKELKEIERDIQSIS